jgi:hypothetical protein
MPGALPIGVLPHLAMLRTMPMWHRPSAGMDGGKQPSVERCPFGILPHLANAADNANTASSKRSIYQPMYCPPLIARFAPVIQRA